MSTGRRSSHFGDVPLADWATRACLIAHETGADVLYVDASMGGPMVGALLQAARDQLIASGQLPGDAHGPTVAEVRAPNQHINAEPGGPQVILGYDVTRPRQTD